MEVSADHFLRLSAPILYFCFCGVSAGFLRGFCGVSAEGPNHVPKVVLQRFVSATKFEVTKFLYKKQ